MHNISEADVGWSNVESVNYLKLAICMVFDRCEV